MNEIRAGIFAFIALFHLVTCGLLGFIFYRHREKPYISHRFPHLALLGGFFSALIVFSLCLQEILLSLGHTFPCFILPFLSAFGYPLNLIPAQMRAWRILLLFRPHLRNKVNIGVFKIRFVVTFIGIASFIAAALYVTLILVFQERNTNFYAGRECYYQQDWYVWFPLLIMYIGAGARFFKSFQSVNDLWGVAGDFKLVTRLGSLSAVSFQIINVLANYRVFDRVAFEEKAFPITMIILVFHYVTPLYYFGFPLFKSNMSLKDIMLNNRKQDRLNRNKYSSEDSVQKSYLSHQGGSVHTDLIFQNDDDMFEYGLYVTNPDDDEQTNNNLLLMSFNQAAHQPVHSTVAMSSASKQHQLLSSQSSVQDKFTPQRKYTISQNGNNPENGSAHNPSDKANGKSEKSVGMNRLIQLLCHKLFLSSILHHSQSALCPESVLFLRSMIYMRNGFPCCLMPLSQHLADDKKDTTQNTPYKRTLNQADSSITPCTNIFILSSIEHKRLGLPTLYSSHEVLRVCMYLYYRYIKSGSLFEINISSTLRNKFSKIIEDIKKNGLEDDTEDEPNNGGAGAGAGVNPNGNEKTAKGKDIREQLNVIYDFTQIPEFIKDNDEEEDQLYTALNSPKHNSSAIALGNTNVNPNATKAPLVQSADVNAAKLPSSTSSTTANGTAASPAVKTNASAPRGRVGNTTNGASSAHKTDISKGSIAQLRPEQSVQLATLAIPSRSKAWDIGGDESAHSQNAPHQDRISHRSLDQTPSIQPTDLNPSRHNSVKGNLSTPLIPPTVTNSTSVTPAISATLPSSIQATPLTHSSIPASSPQFSVHTDKAAPTSHTLSLPGSVNKANRDNSPALGETTTSTTMDHSTHLHLDIHPSNADASKPREITLNLSLLERGHQDEALSSTAVASPSMEYTTLSQNKGYGTTFIIGSSHQLDSHPGTSNNTPLSPTETLTLRNIDSPVSTTSSFTNTRQTNAPARGIHGNSTVPVNPSSRATILSVAVSMNTVNNSQVSPTDTGADKPLPTGYDMSPSHGSMQAVPMRSFLSTPMPTSVQLRGTWQHIHSFFNLFWEAEKECLWLVWTNLYESYIASSAYRSLRHQLLSKVKDEMTAYALQTANEAAAAAAAAATAAATAAAAAAAHSSHKRNSNGGTQGRKGSFVASMNASRRPSISVQTNMNTNNNKIPSVIPESGHSQAGSHGAGGSRNEDFSHTPRTPVTTTFQINQSRFRSSPAGPAPVASAPTASPANHFLVAPHISPAASPNISPKISPTSPPSGTS